MSLFAESLTLTTATADERSGRPTLGSDEEIRRSVQQVLRLIQVRPESIAVERRQDRRYAFPYPVALIPMDPQSGQLLRDQRMVVLGKHLSERGFDFYHITPVPFRRVIASFECQSPRKMDLPRLVLKLSWCRFGQHGWYENGGRFLQVLRKADAALR